MQLATLEIDVITWCIYHTPRVRATNNHMVMIVCLTYLNHDVMYENTWGIFVIMKFTVIGAVVQ